MCVDFIMKNLKLIISLSILFFPFGSIAQNPDKDKITFIKAQYASINQNVSSYKEATKNDGNVTTEGGEVKLYLDTEIRKISAVHYGETGKINEEYYFLDNRLIFYYSVEEKYKRPISITSKVEISKKIENKYYFDKNLLIKYICKPIKQMDNEEMKKEAVKTQTETKRLLSLFINKS